MPVSDTNAIISEPLISTELSDNGCWEVFVRLWGGHELCRRSFISKWQAERSHGELQKKLAACDGDILRALAEWSGRPVLLPLAVE